MIVLRRLLLLLLPLLLAFGGMPVAPAAAAQPHDMHAMHAMHGDHAMPMPEHPAPAPQDHHGSHLCVGCVAPATLAAPAVAVPIGFAALPATRRLRTLAPPVAATPDTPPPRLG